MDEHAKKQQVVGIARAYAEKAAESAILRRSGKAHEAQEAGDEAQRLFILLLDLQGQQDDVST